MADNYVCDGATIECPFCTKPEGTLMVTSNTIKIQDKNFATAKDNQKLNLVFEGNCTKSPFSLVPCLAAIVPGEWEGTGDLKVQGAPALLESSTILCNYGRSTITITDTLQVHQLTQIQPTDAPVVSPAPGPMIGCVTWMRNKTTPESKAATTLHPHDQGDTEITEAAADEKVWLEVYTLGIMPWQKLNITLEDENDPAGEPLRLSAPVDDTGKTVVLFKTTPPKEPALSDKPIKLKATVSYRGQTQEAVITITPYVVNDAYFATKKEHILYDTKQITKEHTAISGDSLWTISEKLLGRNDVEELKKQNGLTSDTVRVGQNFTVTLEEKTAKGKEVTFEQITQASVGDAVYLVVATTALQGTTMNIQVRQGKEKGIGEKDTALTVTQNQTAISQISACVGELADGEAYLNKDYLCNLAVAQVTLAPKEEKEVQQWHDDLEQLTDKKTHLYLHVEADTAATVKYQGKNNDDPQRYGHGEGEWLEVKSTKCYCNRDLTEEEVKSIVIAMRKSESSVYVGNDKENLFFKANCELPEKDKTFERFTSELNNTFAKYDINTCIRKIHFLAQAYHETDRFRTTKEYATTGSYTPYTGRGLMQLTWKKNYGRYKSFTGKDFVTNYEDVAKDLFNAFDSAGWFWDQGVFLSSKAGVWKPPSNAPSYVKSKKPSYTKKIITYKEGETQKKHGTVDLNLVADDDYVDVISWFVNGGSNGLQERRDYVKELKKIFNYETICHNFR